MLSDILISIELFLQSWFCKTIVSIEWYFVLSNFNLMLMEGIYLYNLMFSNFLSEQNEVTTYILLGWGKYMKSTQTKSVQQK